MIKTCVGVLLVAGSLWCNSDPPPGAAVTQDVILPDSALTHMAKLSLIRAGDSFILAGYDGGWVRWGHLSLDGKTLTEELGFPLANPVLGPVFGATKKTVAGDQLIAIVVTNSATSSGGYDVSAIVQTAGAPTPTAAAPVVLGDSLPVGTDPDTVQIAAGAATSGNVGFAAWGIRVRGISPNYLLLPADAVTTAPPATMDPVADWDCLATTNGTSGLGFSVVAPDSKYPACSDFDTFEIDEATGTPTFMLYQFTKAVANCQVVGSPGPKGSYVMALQTSNAIDFAMYSPALDPNQGGTVDTKDPVLSASTFGNPLNMPHPAWASPAAGGDISFGLAHTAGIQVFRFAYNGIPHGSPLTLRSEKGQTGPVAAWVGPDAAYVTYADQTKSGTPAVKRYFMRIESPALP